MFQVAIIGHSLVPRVFSGEEGVIVSVFRKPGGKFSDIDSVEFRGFWENHFDLVIVLLGGNDLAEEQGYTVFERAVEFIRVVVILSSC